MSLSPAFPGLFFAFAGMVLLLFASISPPAWNVVNFLRTTVGGQTTYWGTFGRCVSGGACTAARVGYDLVVPGGPNLTGESVLQRLTNALVIHPVAGGLALLAFLFGLIGILAASRVATIAMAFFAALGGLAALVIFVIDMVLWSLVRNRVRDAGGSAELGNCNWFTIGAAVALFLSMCTSFCGAFGRYASGRAAGEKAVLSYSLTS